MRFVHLFVIVVSKKTHVFSPIPCFQKATSEFNVTIQLSMGCDVVFDAVISLCRMNVIDIDRAFWRCFILYALNPLLSYSART